MTKAEFVVTELSDHMQENPEFRDTLETAVGSSLVDSVNSAAKDVRPELNDGAVTRAEFDEMSPDEQADHIKGGGEVVDA